MVSPNYKLSWTPERREAQRQRMLGKTRVISAETRAKISATLTGRKTGYVMTEHHRAVMATRRGKPTGLKGIPKPDGFGARVSAALKGRPKSEEHRAKLRGPRPEWVRQRMSEGINNRTPEQKSAHIENFKAALTPEIREKIGVTHRGKKLPDHVRAAISASRATAKYPFRNSKPEIAAFAAIRNLGIEYKPHVRLPFNLKHCYDAAIESLRTAVEIDGCYWHGCPEHYPLHGSAQRDRDKRNDSIAEQNGWLVVRLWEHEINSGDFSKLVALRESRNGSSCNTR